jgi:hypothetical protein
LNQGCYFFSSFILLAIIFSFLTAEGDVLHFKNELIDSNQAMKAYGFDQGAESGIRFFNWPAQSYYVVQFVGSVEEKWRESLEEVGVEFFNYIPDNAYYAKVINSKSWDALNAAPFVRAVLPIKPELKISMEIPTPSVFNKAAVSEYFIELINPQDKSNIKKIIEQSGGKGIIEFSESTLVASLSLENAHGLAELDGVQWVEIVPEIQLNDPEFNASDIKPAKMRGDYTDLSGYETGTKLMGFETAWKYGFNGKGQIVGMVDSGLDSGALSTMHYDFRGQILKGYSLSPDKNSAQ